MKTLRILLLALCLVIAGTALAQDTGPGENLAIIFDASGSMQAALGNGTRLSIAREALAELSNSIPQGSNTSLWAYGHRLPQDDPAASCQDIEELIPLAPFEAAQFQSVVGGINAIGYTPITDTLTQVARSLPENGLNTIILISDGEETCAGDPCAAAAALAERNIDLVVNTIGFAADTETRAQLECIARVTGGIYLDAPDADELSAALSAAAQPRAQVRIVDQAGNPLPDVPFRVLRPEDNRVVGSFEGTGAIPAGAYLVEILGDNSATQTITALEGETVDVVVEVPMFGQLQLVKPDGSAINDMQLSAANAETGEAAGSALGALSLAPGIYTVTVNAIVPFTVTAEVKVDETTPIVVDVLAGTIALVDADGNPIEGVTAIITQAESGETLYANSNGVFIVPPGVFDVEIRGINPFETQVTVAADETVEIVVDLSSGFIQLVDADGNPVEGVTAAITQAENADRLFTNDRGRYEVPVGTFEVEVLGLNPFTTEVTVAAGETVEVVVELASGVIQLVDADGNPIEGVTAVITRAESGETLYANSNGVFIVPPGVIDVEIRGLNPFETQVTVGADETVEIEVDVTSGFIQLVDENGNPVRGVTAYITDVARDITLYANDRGLYEVPLGLIRVEFRTTDPATIVDVELTTDGETAEVTVP